MKLPRNVFQEKQITEMKVYDRNRSDNAMDLKRNQNNVANDYIIPT